MLRFAVLLMTLVAVNKVSSEFDDEKKLALASNELAFKLHKTFSSYGNVFISPASISTALGMLYRGARGVTASEMRETLSYDAAGLNDRNVHEYFQKFLSLLGGADDEYKLSIGNAVVSQAQYPVLKEYKDDLKKYYDAIVKEVDFLTEGRKALEDINSWVRNKTESKISELLSSLDPGTVMVILNAIYFKGTWKTQFSPSNTRKQTFYNDGIDVTSVAMMNSKNSFLYGDFSELGVQALKMPYKGETVSMVILLPFERNGLSKVEKKLTVREFDRILSGMESSTVLVTVPKFKLEDSRELKMNLTNLGMRSAFTNGANLAGISEQANLKVDKIIHKAVVEVNEEGSEAAAATAVLIVPYSSSSSYIKYFHVEHPFLFFIRDERTGMILFSGRVSRL